MRDTAFETIPSPLPQQEEVTAYQMFGEASRRPPIQRSVPTLIQSLVKAHEPMDEPVIPLNPAFDVDLANTESENPPSVMGSGVAQSPAIGPDVQWQPHFPNRHFRRAWVGRGNAIIEKATLLNKWEGEVLDVRDDSFTARIFDLSRPNIVEMAEFSFTEVGIVDLPLIRPGCQFYWYIMNEDSRSGQRTAGSLLWFRRGGRRNQETEYRNELIRLEEMWTDFGWGNDGVDTSSAG